MTAEERIAALDGRFVAIYEAARRRRLDAQMGRALLLVVDDVMLFYHGGREPEVIPGMRPPLYDKLKTLSHVSLAIYCLLSGRSGDEAAAPPDLLDELRDYRAQLAATADDLDADEAFEAGLLPHRVEIYARSLGLPRPGHRRRAGAHGRPSGLLPRQRAGPERLLRGRHPRPARRLPR